MIDKNCHVTYTITCMYTERLFNYYRFGRFVFVSALLMAFQIAGSPFTELTLTYVLLIYGIVSFVRCVIPSSTISYFDFLLDLILITAMVFFSPGTYSLLMLLFLIPVFFSSVLMKTWMTAAVPVLSVLCSVIVYYGSGATFGKEHLLSVSLYFFSFSLISFVGHQLNQRLVQQEHYIKSLEKERIKMQGFERLYRVSADLAHELRNPLASISGAVQFLKEGRRDSDLIDLLSEETGRLTNLVNDFLFFARPSEAPREEVDVSEMLKTLVVHQKCDRQVVTEIPEGVTIVANRSLTEIAVTNILKNAIEASRAIIRISLKKMKVETAIEVEDDGPGVPEESRDNIFEPFFTTKPHGTGLGLAISHRIITSFGGNITLARSPLGGAKFTMVLPAAETPRQGEKPYASADRRR